MSSGYFAEPSGELDPDLFDGYVMKESVRTGLLNLLFSDLENDVGLREPWNWVSAWVAGSGASYQWGNGDLDVLFGVDLPGFLADNPQFPRLAEREVANYIDKLLKQRSWPKSRNVTIGGSKKKYEITFFWNPGVHDDISVINPYAAYDLIMNRWDVRPSPLPSNPHALYPKEWYDFADTDYRQALSIEGMSKTGGSLGRVQASRAARTLWEGIHGGRKAAFGEQGSGYGDFHNFRWQRAKEVGTVDILRGLMDTDTEPEDTPEDIITRAALRYATNRYQA